MSSYVSYIALVTNYSSAASFFVTAAGKKRTSSPVIQGLQILVGHV